MNCRVCDSSELYPVARAHDNARVRFHRCVRCGSDTSDADPASVTPRYQTEAYRQHNVTTARGDFEKVVESCSANQRWFDDYAPTLPGKTFLDVGSNEGAMLEGMRRRGWAVRGFDVNSHCAGPDVTVAPAFAASLFQHPFAAVCCREVVEHVGDWRGLIRELFAATAPGGVCQVQTPRPWPGRSDAGYQEAHLQLFSPLVLWVEFERVGFKVEDRWLWPAAHDREGAGQALMLRRPS